MKSRWMHWAFLAFALANVVGHAIGSEELTRLTKPLLMPILLLIIYVSSKGGVTLRILLLGLAIILSWIGDVALMYAGSMSFVTGIGFFLLAQVTYIVVLYHSTYGAPAFSFIKILPFVAFSTALFALLIPNAGDFKVPIFIYGIVISTMAAMARLRAGFTNDQSYQLALLGSLFFVLSDTLLAISKFYYPLPVSGVWVMSTYCTAQYLLMIGILRHVE